MTKFHYENTTVLLVEPNSEIRSEMKKTLTDMGFNNVSDTGNMKGVQDFFWDKDVHLLIGETKLAEGDLGPLIHKIRHQEYGHCPFMVVIALISGNEHIQSAIDAGADDVLLKPFPHEKLCERVYRLTESRKRFVVTTDYIGPDRRHKARSEGLSVSLINVPNPLHANYCGNDGAKALHAASQKSLALINRHKVERHAFQIHWLMERIGPALLEGHDLMEGAEAEIAARMQMVATDLNRRVLGSDYAYAAFMCKTLVNATEKLNETPKQFDQEDAQLLDKLSKQILRACSPEPTYYLNNADLD